MTTYKAYKFRLYPTKKQRHQINKTIGCTRFVYNYYLNYQTKKGYKKSKYLCQDLKNLIKTYPFLEEVDSCALRCAIFQLEDNYKLYLSQKSNIPNFKKKYQKQSYKITYFKPTHITKYANIELNIEKQKIKLPELNYIKIKGYKKTTKINGDIISITVTKELNNKYYASALYKEIQKQEEKVTPKTIVGLDLGIKDLITTSDGIKYSNKKTIIKYEKRLKRLQKELSRRKNKTKNYCKTKLKINKLHIKIKNSRKYYLNEIANEIVNDHDIIVTENLNTIEMMKNKSNLSKYINDASFITLCKLIEHKSIQQGKYYYKVDPYYPSSQICSHCGHQNKITKDLAIRNYICPVCNRILDRDINASLNILSCGLVQHYQK